MFPWHQYLLGLILVVAGFFHIQKPKLFLSIMPGYMPVHKLLVLISGISEMVLGLILLTPQGQSTAAGLTIAMFVVYLPIHWHMIAQPPQWYKWHKAFLWLRLILQFGLIYWALQYI